MNSNTVWTFFFYTLHRDICMTFLALEQTYMQMRACVCVCVCVCGHVYVVYEDTNLYNDMGMT